MDNNRRVSSVFLVALHLSNEVQNGIAVGGHSSFGPADVLEVAKCPEYVPLQRRTVIQSVIEPLQPKWQQLGDIMIFLFAQYA